MPYNKLMKIVYSPSYFNPREIYALKEIVSRTIECKLYELPENISDISTPILVFITPFEANELLLFLTTDVYKELTSKIIDIQSKKNKKAIFMFITHIDDVPVIIDCNSSNIDTLNYFFKTIGDIVSLIIDGVKLIEKEVLSIVAYYKGERKGWRCISTPIEYMEFVFLQELVTSR